RLHSPNRCWLGWVHPCTHRGMHMQTNTCTHMHVHSAHALLSQCFHPPRATGATPAQLVAAAVGQRGWPLPQPRHRAGHTGRTRKVSAQSELSENYYGGREKATSFPPTVRLMCVGNRAQWGRGTGDMTSPALCPWGLPSPIALEGVRSPVCPCSGSAQETNTGLRPWIALHHSCWAV
uniref:Uncharacterized protein n=1 Tax=Cyanoderma ruficeps TaxID=181631 RepID=A0A8C3QEF6_9PASS